MTAIDWDQQVISACDPAKKTEARQALFDAAAGAVEAGAYNPSTDLLAEVARRNSSGFSLENARQAFAFIAKVTARANVDAGIEVLGKAFRDVQKRFSGFDLVGNPVYPSDRSRYNVMQACGDALLSLAEARPELMQRDSFRDLCRLFDNGKTQRIETQIEMLAEKEKKGNFFTRLFNRRARREAEKTPAFRFLKTVRAFRQLLRGAGPAAANPSP